MTIQTRSTGCASSACSVKQKHVSGSYRLLQIKKQQQKKKRQLRKKVDFLFGLA